MGSQLKTYTHSRIGNKLKQFYNVQHTVYQLSEVKFCICKLTCYQISHPCPKWFFFLVIFLYGLKNIFFVLSKICLFCNQVIMNGILLGRYQLVFHCDWELKKSRVHFPLIHKVCIYRQNSKTELVWYLGQGYLSCIQVLVWIGLNILFILQYSNTQSYLLYYRDQMDLIFYKSSTLSQCFVR